MEVEDGFRARFGKGDQRWIRKLDQIWKLWIVRNRVFGIDGYKDRFVVEGKGRQVCW